VNKVLVDILGLSASPSAGGAYALLLKETYGVRRLPIIIGSFEAQSIALELEGIKPPRPLTHDLLKNLIDHLGATITEVIIDELRENTFYAKIRLDVSTLVHEIDARPSDAIALAVRTGTPLFVSDEVMRVAAYTPSSEDTDEENTDTFDEDIENGEKIEEDKTPQELKLAQLRDWLREAIDKEDYERAAKLRDEINRLGNSTSQN
jgi:uncharacterized protein